MTALACHNVEVAYATEAGTVRALAGIDFTMEMHDGVALVGRSGCGKTTLLHVLSGLVDPTGGELVRNARTSLVFQGANLLPHFTALENVRFAESGDSDAELLLSLVGLEPKSDHLPRELSGGESQRVALARSLAQKPDILLCDEPTGHLDSDTAARVLDLIDALRAELGFGIVVATHDPNVGSRWERTIELRDGLIVAEQAR